MEDLLYCKDLYKPIKVKDKPSTMDDGKFNIEKILPILEDGWI